MLFAFHLNLNDKRIETVYNSFIVDNNSLTY